MDVPRCAFDLRQLIQEPPQLGAQLIDVGSRLHQQRPHGTAAAVEHRQHHMRGLQNLVVTPERKRLRIGERRLKFGRQFVLSHLMFLNSSVASDPRDEPNA